jgi:hypothetical protein
MIVDVGRQTMDLVVADDLEDDAVVLEYRLRRRDVKPVFAMIFPEDAERRRSVITFDDLTTGQFFELLSNARSQPAVESLGGPELTAASPLGPPSRPADPDRTPGLEWRDEDDGLLVSLWLSPRDDRQLWIRVWREVEPRAVEEMAEVATAHLLNRAR